MSPRAFLFIMALIAACGVTAASGAASVQNEHPSGATADPYLWLENIHGAKPLAWVKEQNAKSRSVLQTDPDYQKDYEAILKVLDATDRIPYGSLEREYVFNFWQDADHPKGIWRRTNIGDYASPAPHWETLLDLDKLSADEHENWVWESPECSPLLKRCLLSLSRGGGDAVVVREFDLATRSFIQEGFTLSEAKSSISYLDEDTVLVATDFGAGSMTTSGYARIVKLWKRGTPMAQARQLFEGKTADVLAQPSIYHDPAGTIALVVRAVTFFTTEYQWLRLDGTLLPLPLPLGADLKGAQGGHLIFSLREDWAPPGAALIPKGALIAYQPPDDKSRTDSGITVLFAPDAKSSIDEVACGRDAVFASIYHDVTGSVHAFRAGADGRWSDTVLPMPAGGSTHIVSANAWGPQALLRYESYTTPTTLYEFADDGRPRPIKSLPPRFDATGLATEQFFATSKDGTRVPYFVTRATSQKGPAPTVLYGYGGFEISLTPSYSANFGMLWLSKGGVYVVANIRGGGEYGPGWHQAALLANRQKAYDDFQAVARDLVRRGITTPKQLGIMGGSNGGLLVSANMVEAPELFGAVVCQVPLIDMIRYTQIGAGASWEAEYGDPAKKADRAWILGYSPYQNVSASKRYPPVLFVTATSDDRVTPVHARKMAARMEEQGHEVLFYENTDGGHAAAANHKQAAEMWALSFVYLKQKLAPAGFHD
jgi:prolyl oligopeptidase